MAGEKTGCSAWTEIGAQHVGVIQSLITTCKLHGYRPVRLSGLTFCNASTVHPDNREIDASLRRAGGNTRFADHPATVGSCTMPFDIDGLNLEELYELNDRVVERIKMLANHAGTRRHDELQPGCPGELRHRSRVASWAHSSSAIARRSMWQAMTADSIGSTPGYAVCR